MQPLLTILQVHEGYNAFASDYRAKDCWYKKRKTDLKNGRNRKTENPNASSEYFYLERGNKSYSE